MVDQVLILVPGRIVPRTAVSFGADGTKAYAVSAANLLPVTMATQDVRSVRPPPASTATIAVAGSLSGAVDLDPGRLHRIGVRSHGPPLQSPSAARPMAPPRATCGRATAKS